MTREASFTCPHCGRHFAQCSGPAHAATCIRTLSDKERESDRHQADKVLGVVRADLAAAIQRAEAAETALAAAPLDALRVTVELARVTLLHRTDRGVSTDAAAVAAAARWLAERGEGQS